MIEQINLGNIVDDGTGDYLRLGGEKINQNFEEIAYKLGDGVTVHPAGAWKTIDGKTETEVSAVFGNSYTLNTQENNINVYLPKGGVKDYNKVIRLRDVFNSWDKRNVSVIAASGDTIRGTPEAVKLDLAFQDVEFVYCAPGRWEFLKTKQLSRITSGSSQSVLKKEFIAEEGQTDFLNVFGDTIEYNSKSIDIHVRGNLLYHGTEFNENSDFGSPDGNVIGPLNGKDIRLANPLKAGDAVIITTFIDDVGQLRSTYNTYTITVLDEKLSNVISPLNAATHVVNFADKVEITPAEFGHINGQFINYNALEVYINGVLAKRSQDNEFSCSGYDATDMDSCLLRGGSWVPANEGYRLILENNILVGLDFGYNLMPGDVITITWFNNEIGTLLEMDDIEAKFNSKYIHSKEIEVTGAIWLNDTENPNNSNISFEESRPVTVDSVDAVFDLIYPIGTCYENFLNPNNPATYLLGGVWVLAGKNRTTVGWDPNETDFTYNNNDLGVNGKPSKSAGGTGGAIAINLGIDQLPATATDSAVLVADPKGSIVVGGCQFDPDEEGPVYSKYSEVNATINAANDTTKEINVMNPYITVYRWMRIA